MNNKGKEQEQDLYGKEDLREYSDQELDLRVMNDEYLYVLFEDTVEMEDFSLLKDIVDECFIYTEEQLEELRESFESEVAEVTKKEQQELVASLPVPEYPRDYNTTTNQEIKQKFVNQHVFACVTNVVEFILAQSYDSVSKDVPFGWDDVENLYTEEDEDRDSEQKEIFEWWIISRFLYDKLSDKGYSVIDDGLNCYWGRITTGQSIMLDGVISRICFEMEILDGQEYSWRGGK